MIPLWFWVWVIPGIACSIGYAIKTYVEWNDDVQRSRVGSYTPSLYWSTVMGRLLIVLIPVVNFIAFLVDLMLPWLADRLETVLEFLHSPVVKGKDHG